MIWLVDHRCGLEHALLELDQAVDARGEDRLHRVQNLDPLARAGETKVPALALQVPGLDQRLDHLLGEEGVPGGAGFDHGR
jgi:hypothetical protein